MHFEKYSSILMFHFKYFSCSSFRDLFPFFLRTLFYFPQNHDSVLFETDIIQMQLFNPACSLLRSSSTFKHISALNHRSYHCLNTIIIFNTASLTPPPPIPLLVSSSYQLEYFLFPHALA